MNLSDIEELVEREVVSRSEEVYRQLFTRACDSHRKGASYSNCLCPYCATIKRYVRAKIRFNHLNKDRTGKYMTSRLFGPDKPLIEAQTEYIRQMKEKDAVKLEYC